MSYSSLVIIRKCHQRRNVPKRTLQKSKSGNSVLSEDFPLSLRPIHLFKKHLSGTMIPSTFTISKASNLQSSFLFYTHVDIFRWGLKFSIQLNALVPLQVICHLRHLEEGFIFHQWNSTHVWWYLRRSSNHKEYRLQIQVLQIKYHPRIGLLELDL